MLEPIVVAARPQPPANGHEPKLSPRQQTLIAYIEHNPKFAAFNTASELAHRVGVHPATVVRLAQMLGYRGFPKSVCTSVNEVVCHGIPDDRPLRNGDIVNVDVTVIKDGWHGDNSRMYIVGEGSIAARRLSQITYEAMWKGIVKVRPGARLGDIGHAIQTHAEAAGFSVVREFCGHGVGARFHEEPQVLHYGRPGTLDELVPGMIFTIEPMINAGRRDIKEDRRGNRPYDGWTIVTRDRSLSAQWEHSVLVTDGGYEVLTVSAGSPPPPSFAAHGFGTTLVAALPA